MKTFYTGIGGWAGKQLPDGTVEWTAPTGHAYTTTPGGSIFFPMLADPTGELKLACAVERPRFTKGLMMPRRERKRTEDRRYRITAERRINEQPLADLARRGLLDLEALVTRRIGLDDVEAAFTDMAAGRGARSIVCF